MNKPEPTYFRINNRSFFADGVIAIVQINEKDVEVRYASKGGAVLITDTTVEKVTAAIDAVKSKRR
jgi:hypothetical protein